LNHRPDVTAAQKRPYSAPRYKIGERHIDAEAPTASFSIASIVPSGTGCWHSCFGAAE